MNEKYSKDDLPRESIHIIEKSDKDYYQIPNSKMELLNSKNEKSTSKHEKSTSETAKKKSKRVN